jgi:hypothetical protein
MIYRVCEHYYNDDLQIVKNEEDKTDECFVCFQTETDDGLKPISLRYQHLYIKKCSCDGQIHIKCLEMWCKKNFKCPICRIQLRENIQFKNVLLIITVRTHIMYLHLIRIITIVARLTTLFLFIYTSLQYLYFMYLMKHLNKDIHDDYSYEPYSGFDFIDKEIIRNTT